MVIKMPKRSHLGGAVWLLSDLKYPTFLKLTSGRHLIKDLAIQLKFLLLFGSRM